MGTEFGARNLSLQMPDLSTMPKVHLLPEGASHKAGIPVGLKSAVKGAHLSQPVWFQCNSHWAAVSPRKAKVNEKRRDFIPTCEITKYKRGESEYFDFRGKPGADRELQAP